MKDSLKKVLSKRGIVIALVALLILSAFNTYLIFEGTRSSMSTSPVAYDYALSIDGGNYKLKNMLTGYVSEQRESASTALNAAFSAGKSVYLNAGIYTLIDDIYITNKINAKLVGNNDATINGNGHKIIIYGDDYTSSKYALISGLTIINATVHVENSFETTIQDTLFENTSIGIEFLNSNTWSEYNKIEDCQFINATEGIAFRTPIGSGTGSYASSTIERCSFNIQDNSVGIKVERLAEVSDSQLQAIRFWMGENEHTDQTALFVDGSMYQTLLLGVVFESFTSEPVNMYAIDLGRNCDPAPILYGGVSFLGNWTARFHDPYNIWISAVGSVFDRENINIPVGTNNQYGASQSIECRPLKIMDFKPKIAVSGSFNHNETITVRIRIEYIDNVISTPITKTFTQSISTWLTDDEIMQLLPSQSVIWAILVDAKANTASTDATVTVSGYGTAG